MLNSKESALIKGHPEWEIMQTKFQQQWLQINCLFKKKKDEAS